MGLIDGHAHLTFPELRDQIDDVLDRCTGAGVDNVITVGTDLADGRAAVDLAKRYPSRVHAAAAFHPHEAGAVTDDDLAGIAELWADPAIVGLGEMGLDYHYDFVDRAVQRRVFADQLRLAARLDKPVVIHSREAFDDTVQLLGEHGFRDRPVVFHCFTGTRAEAQRVEAGGWRISFAGVVTFKKSGRLQEIAQAYPADRLMVETDSPYLSPEPVRSRRPNEPAFVAHTARFLSELRGEGFAELAAQTARNTREFFSL
ncbi:MAG: TatD family hydrolase [Planctomycetes bacterium]|nr:TatD family hydrolase [Planctomycetota bacterium]